MKKKVLLIDLDPQFNATQCLYGGEDYVARRSDGGHTIVDIFNDASPPSISPVAGALSKSPIKLEDVKPWMVKSGFDIIPGDLEIYRIDMAAGHGKEMRLKRYLEKVEGIYDYVIIDTPPTPSHYMMSSLVASDYYLVPVRPEPLSRVGIDLLRGCLETPSV